MRVVIDHWSPHPPTASDSGSREPSVVYLARSGDTPTRVDFLAAHEQRDPAGRRAAALLGGLPACPHLQSTPPNAAPSARTRLLCVGRPPRALAGTPGGWSRRARAWCRSCLTPPRTSSPHSSPRSTASCSPAARCRTLLRPSTWALRGAGRCRTPPAPPCRVGRTSGTSVHRRAAVPSHAANVRPEPFGGR